jgi:hypothetical protein
MTKILNEFVTEGSDGHTHVLREWQGQAIYSRALSGSELVGYGISHMLTADGRELFDEGSEWEIVGTNIRVPKPPGY